MAMMMFIFSEILVCDLMTVVWKNWLLSKYFCSRCFLCVFSGSVLDSCGKLSWPHSTDRQSSKVKHCGQLGKS